MSKELKLIIRQIEQLQATLNALKQKIASEMDPERDEAGRLLCWACGGKMRRTMYHYNCKQDNGPCGYITVHYEKDPATGFKKTWFWPTQANHDGTPRPHDCSDHAFINLFVVGGEVYNDEGGVTYGNLR